MTEQAPEPLSQVERVTRLLVTSIAPSLLAVVAVASVITALYVWQQDEVGATKVVATATESQRPSISSPSTAATPTSAASSPSAVESTSASATPEPTPTARTTSAKPTRRLSVDVLNQTGRSGLARVVADRLRARGWSVVQVGNFRGTVSATTVYYPRGASSEAAELAAALPVPRRTRPAFANLSASRLTVVITDNYPR